MCAFKYAQAYQPADVWAWALVTQVLASWAKATLSSEKDLAIALAIVKLHLTEGSQSVSKNIYINFIFSI